MAEVARAKRAPTAGLIVAAFLILDCLWRLFTRGGPWPVPPWHYISMLFDLILLGSVVAALMTRPAPAANAPLYVRNGGLLLGGGIVAGIILIGLRLTSDHAWWTGHWR